MVKILIVHEDSPGINEDVVVLTDVIYKSFGNADIFNLSIAKVRGLEFYDILSIPDVVSDAAPFDVLFFLEHIIFHPIFRERSNFKNIVFIPNIEWILPMDEELVHILNIETVLFKNDFSLRQSQSHGIFQSSSRRVLSGWSSVYVENSIGKLPKDFGTLLHLAGSSDQKGTKELIDAWSSQSDMPTLIVRHWGESKILPFSENENSRIDIIKGRLSSYEVVSLQRESGIHIYPSTMEGFGHSLNRCRAAGSVLLTTAGYPMSEFVTDGYDGFLIKAKSRPLRRSLFYTIDPSDVARVVRHVVSMSDDILLVIGRTARSRFWKEKAEFEHRFIEIFS